MRILGVDPGALGALALIENGKLVGVFDMPILRIRRGKTDKAEVDARALRDLIKTIELDVAYLEQVGGFTGQSASAAFNFGRAAGVVEGWLKGAGVRVEWAPPATWKRELKVNGGKDGSRAKASNLWPVQAGEFRRVKDDGRAEAALIAEFGRRKEMRNVFFE
jgi:crossover junction endodeoxyribonuclease RuvC